MMTSVKPTDFLSFPTPFAVSRRKWLVGAGAVLAVAAGPTRAQFRVEISGIGGTQIPLAVASLRDEALCGVPLSAIVRADLQRSGAFNIVDAPGTLDERSRVPMEEQRNRGSDHLVVGSVSKLADGRFDLRYKLWDVVTGQERLAQSMAVHPADLRLAAHRMADAVYAKILGEPGAFATRIAYITRAGKRYRLHITDADGEGGQVAVDSGEPLISPAWSPDGKSIAYVSFESQKAVVWLQDVQTGRRNMLANYRGSNSAPAFAPSGRELALTLSRDAPAQLYVMPVEGGTPRRLTQSNAIDTEPAYAPDGRSIYFVSDRGGGPQVYRVASSGGTADRITFGGNYNISPAISPDGRSLAYITRQGGAFKLMVLDLVSNEARSLTDTSEDERPSFAPNGRLIVYATRSQGRDVLMTTTLDGKIKTRLLATNADMREPAWGPLVR